jgi:hypothetical protein
MLSKYEHVVLSRHISSDILTQVAALCTKLRHVKDKNVTEFIVLRDKGGKEIKL